MTPILECRNLSKMYGRLNVLNNLNVLIPKGKIVGLLGPNGSGKTTFIKIAAGLLTSTGGELFVDGNRPGIYTKSIVSYLPERTYIQPWMKVDEILEFFDDFYEDFDRERAYGMLERLEVSKQSKLQTLSKGTKEKVQLVLVMSRRAKLYLLDEPIGGVDPAAREYILNTIVSNYGEDSTILISTHLISDIEKTLDEFLFLKNGSVIMQGEIDTIRQEQGKSIDELFREVFRC